MACEGRCRRYSGVGLAVGLLLLGATAARSEMLSVGSGGGASLSGFAYCDVDNDALRSDREIGLAGVNIVLDGVTVDGELVLKTTKTAKDGSFRFDDLQPGTYTVMEEQPERYVPGKPNTPGTAGGEILTADRFMGIVLSAGQQASGYQFGEWGLKAKYISKKRLCHVIPEPAAAWLLLAGLVSAGLLARRARSSCLRV